jgi:hypothetical protein
MKILDSSTINYILENNVNLKGVYYITPDIENEISAARIVLDKQILSNIKNILAVGDDFLSESVYLRNYFYILNKYGGRSFYNMTGFGDVSILAAVKSLIDQEEKNTQKKLPLFNISSQIFVYLEDEDFKKKAKKEFGKRVVLQSYKNL